MSGAERSFQTKSLCSKTGLCQLSTHFAHLGRLEVYRLYVKFDEQHLMNMGFPPSGSGRLVNGVNLQPAARREIERKIFGPVPESEEKYIKEYRDRLTVTFDTTAIDEDGGAYWESDSDDDFHPKDM